MEANKFLSLEHPLYYYKMWIWNTKDYENDFATIKNKGFIRTYANAKLS